MDQIPLPEDEIMKAINPDHLLRLALNYEIQYPDLEGYALKYTDQKEAFTLDELKEIGENWAEQIISEQERAGTYKSVIERAKYKEMIIQGMIDSLYRKSNEVTVTLSKDENTYIYTFRRDHQDQLKFNNAFGTNVFEKGNMQRTITTFMNKLGNVSNPSLEYVAHVKNLDTSQRFLLGAYIQLNAEEQMLNLYLQGDEDFINFVIKPNEIYIETTDPDFEDVFNFTTTVDGKQVPKRWSIEEILNNKYIIENWPELLDFGLRGLAHNGNWGETVESLVTQMEAMMQG